MNLDDLLKSIREEDSDSKGAKIDPEKFLKRKTFTNPLKGQMYQAPGIPSAPAIKPSIVQIDPKKLIPEVAGEEFGEKIDDLVRVINEDNKLEKKDQKQDTRKLEEDKKKYREDKIEEKKKTKGFVLDLKKSTGKIRGFFDKLKSFIKLGLISGLINTLYNFFTDPKNKDKIAATQKFLKDWWPALAAAITLIFTPFKGLILKTIGFLISTTSQILKLFATNPIFGIAVAFGVSGVMDYLKGKNRKLKIKKEVEDLMESEGISETEARKKLIQQKEDTAKDMPYSMNPFDDKRREILKEAEQLKNIDFERGRYGFNLLAPPINRAPGFSGGGLSMGTDIIPAMLTPGEFVMSRGAVNMFGADTMMAMNKSGGGTNRPKYGKVMGLQGGGYVDFAKEMVKQHEGFKIVDGMHHAYPDSKGLPTIGYGHLITPGDGYSMSSRISQQEADKLFDKDFKYHNKHAEKIPGFGKASDQQKAALIDLTFNMGPSWHKNFPGFSKAFAAGDYETAANELRYKDATSPNLEDSKYYKDVKPRRADPILSLIRGAGIGNAPHLKETEKLLPANKDSKTKIQSSANNDSKTKIQSPSFSSGSMQGPAFDNDESAYVNAPSREYQRFGRKIEMMMKRFTAPVQTPNIPTETRNFTLPPIDAPKQKQSASKGNDVPSFSVVSGNKMRDLISKNLGISDLAGVS